MESQNPKCPETDSDIEIPSEKAAEAKVLDDIFDQLCAIVTKEGPYHLMRGCTQLEANTAILRCIEAIKNQRDLAFRIIDALEEWHDQQGDILPLPEYQLEELKCLRQTTG